MRTSTYLTKWIYGTLHLVVCRHHLLDLVVEEVVVPNQYADLPALPSHEDTWHEQPLIFQAFTGLDAFAISSSVIVISAGPLDSSAPQV